MEEDAGIEELAVIYVDDTDLLLSAFMRGMRGAQYRVRTYTDPVQALQEIQAEKGLAVLVSDYKMPGMLGDQLLERAAQAHPSAIRILTSSDEMMLAEMRLRGIAHDYVDKNDFIMNARRMIDKALMNYVKAQSLRLK